MTDTEHDLLAAVRRDPFDDGPRLVMADWYDENGEPDRAEFIRVQCQYPKCFDMTCECPHDPNGFRTGITCPDPVRKAWEYTRNGLSDFGDTIPGVYINTRHFRGAEVTIRRGFPDHVTLSLNQLMGGECESCVGANLPTRLNWGSGSLHCGPCHGTGTTPGLADELSLWPLSGVRLSCREPDDDVHTLPSFTWWRDDSKAVDFEKSLIPQDIFNLIDATEMIDWGDTRKSFDTPAAAHTDLSRACVDMLRSRRGDPAMRWPGEKPKGPPLTGNDQADAFNYAAAAMDQLQYTGDTP